ncbi:terpenoid cyclases/protein prenyltransferase alpha-alpha toroid [Dimargaris cristalligena]|uniref:Geranylgeranyl transferase type-2 subunit beta n=1 Tax=Dimargaris cristalligena TaxID=215637 RepID=A0A4P9ZZ69_9FUNG|nr:terpenoid cyclases/protein prenyltransferase alpha-alpha toroid [Dimargaris cristalligena]|eukprot:RKP38381.1 terpenoid cyclases/protein prenyltransferase alpha-alpha toroid [Dimargaris cristalligena]
MSNHQFLRNLHIQFIEQLDKKQDALEYWYSEHLRLSGVYWGLTALQLMGCPDLLGRDAVIKYVLSCQHPNGGFGGHPDHDPHLLYTLSAIQILLMYDAMDHINTYAVVSFIQSLYDKDTGSFKGDRWGEIDTRFSYCAVACLSLLQALDSIDLPRVVEFILACRNVDGGFGSKPGAESHAGQVFCCVGALAIVRQLDSIDRDLLGTWLANRQLKNGGLNGRPQKLEDVCYSWWVLSSLSIIGRQHWIDRAKLRDFILSSQDPETGGIADRAGDVPDVFHTLFGIAGLSLLGYEDLEPVDPMYCLPLKLTEQLGLHSEPGSK